jgi:hypothetical protein
VYDGASRLNFLTQQFNGNLDNLVQTFGYNPASQIISETRDNDSFASFEAGATSRTYASNGLNQYVSAGPASFTYGLNGN